LSVSGLLTDKFVFLGFPPTRPKDRKSWMDHLKTSGSVAVFYEAPHRIIHTLEEIRTSIGDAYVVVVRELTKAHEELVRGPISGLLYRNLNPRGEFTVVIDIGQMANNVECSANESDRRANLVDEFGRMTIDAKVTRRQVISTLARKYGLTAREAYEAV